jgi:hypothetical protein
MYYLKCYQPQKSSVVQYMNEGTFPAEAFSSAFAASAPCLKQNLFPHCIAGSGEWLFSYYNVSRYLGLAPVCYFFHVTAFSSTALQMEDSKHL